MNYLVYDFTDSKKNSVISTWIAANRLQKRDIAQLNQKLDMLRLNGFDLHPRLLAGPIKKQQHIYKLVIHGQQMLRPMLCKGPFDMHTEFTLLTGAIEKGFKLAPDPSAATLNRETLVDDPTRRLINEGY